MRKLSKPAWTVTWSVRPRAAGRVTVVAKREMTVWVV
jgi:hypothetical protein